MANLDAIRGAQKAYHHEWDAFTTAASTPATVPGMAKVDFTAGGYTAFQNLGWVADGKVRCQYSTLAVAGSSSARDDFTATAICDLDGDSSNSQFNANRAEQAVMVTSNNVY